MRVHSRARAGTFSLETTRFFSSWSGRAYTLVPELTYPFCTRVALCDSGLSARTLIFVKPGASDASGKAPETALFVGNQQPRAALLPLLHCGRRTKLLRPRLRPESSLALTASNSLL